jgi:hypothetical protein
MKKGLFAVFLISLFTHIAEGQTIKTGVLVIGNGSNAIGAGFQSARSGVKTIMLTQEAGLIVSATDKNINSGLEAEFLKRMRLAKGIQDSIGKVYVDGTSANVVLKSWADSIKNLTVIRSVKWSRIKRSGNNWNVLLADGRTIKAEVMVNADATGNVSEALILPESDRKLWQPFSYKDNLYRLSISAGYEMRNTTSNIIPMINFLIPKQENIIVLDRRNESIAAGQAGGATAAYAVFFRTKTSLSVIKPIQKELINYRLAVVPFADVDYRDPSWRAIQYIGLTGFLKAGFVDGKTNFIPELVVSTAEIREPLKEFYYKAQIWFDDYKEENMTLGSTISMICMVGNRAQENTRAEIKKMWTTVYHFKHDFDLNREINRREFAVLVDAYLNPFSVNVDKTGRVIR